MIQLPQVYKTDIDSTVTSIDTLIVIKTDPEIYISTDKGMFNIEQQTVNQEDLTLEEFYAVAEMGSYPNDPLYGPVYDTYEVLHPELWAFVQSLLDWIENDVGGTLEGPPEQYMWTIFKRLLTDQNPFQTNLFENWEEVSDVQPPIYGTPEEQRAMFEQWWSANMVFEEFVNTFEYFEDRDLKVSNISESIDLKKKNFKINKVNITLCNYIINESKFSNLIKNSSLVGIEIDVYYKSQSATKLSDCLKICDGKIRRYTHDNDTVKLEIEDRTIDKLHKTLPLPEHTLYSELDVLENHIGKPIPILYGQLEKAPSILYTISSSLQNMYDNNNILIMYDNASIAGHTVRGTKRVDENITGSDIETGILYIKDGDKYLEIPHRSYNNLTAEVQAEHDYPQYTLEDSYLRLTTKSGNTTTYLSRHNALWCHYLHRPISRFNIGSNHSSVLIWGWQNNSTFARFWHTDYAYRNLVSCKYDWTNANYPTSQGHPIDYETMSFQWEANLPNSDNHRVYSYKNPAVTYNFNPF